MLPENWKKEIGDAIEKADASNAERHEAQIASQNAIAAPLDRLANKFDCYKSKYENADNGRKNREIAGLIGVYLSALLVFITAVVFYCQLREMQKAYGPLRDSADTAQKTLIASERPWVEITGIDIAQDITFDANGASISLRLGLRNRGHSPALSILPWVSGYVRSPLPEFQPPVVIGLDGDYPNVLFPDVDISRQPSGWVGADQMTWLMEYNAKSKIDFFPIIVDACVRYKFADSAQTYLTCDRLNFRNADKTKGIQVLRLPNPLAPIPKASIGFDYLPKAAAY